MVAIPWALVVLLFLSLPPAKAESWSKIKNRMDRTLERKEEEIRYKAKHIENTGLSKAEVRCVLWGEAVFEQEQKIGLEARVLYYRFRLKRYYQC